MSANECLQYVSGSGMVPNKRDFTLIKIVLLNCVFATAKLGCALLCSLSVSMP